jgi:hypothetical protein
MALVLDSPQPELMVLHGSGDYFVHSSVMDAKLDLALEVIVLRVGRVRGQELVSWHRISLLIPCPLSSRW